MAYSKKQKSRLSDLDKQRAKDVPIMDVLNAEGISPDEHGAIRCLSPTHKDNNPSCRIWKAGNMLRCWSCGAKFDTIGVVQAVEGLGFTDAVRKVLKIGGIQEEGEDDPGYNLPTLEELRLLGITTKPVYTAANLTDAKPKDGRYLYDPDGYVVLKPADFNPSSFLVQNIDTYYRLIRGKAAEKYEKLEAVKKRIVEGIRGGDYQYLFMIAQCGWDVCTIQKYIDEDKMEEAGLFADSIDIDAIDGTELAKNVLRDILMTQKRLKGIILRYRGNPKKTA